MLACVAAGGLAFNVPSFSALERTLFSANREAEGLLRRLRRAESNGEDALSRLQQSDHVLTPGSAILITGASDGLGKEAARALACDFGYPCILAVRDIQKGEEAASELRAASPTARLEVVELDLSSYSSVEAGAVACEEAAAKLDVPLRGLLLNAGCWPTSRQASTDGLELGFATNHVGHMQLAQRLLPTIRSTLGEGDEARVVSTASSAHAFADVFDPENKVIVPGTSGSDFESTEAYGATKLANVQFTMELAERERATGPGKLTALSVHPGVVATSLFREFGDVVNKSPVAAPLNAVLGASPISPPSQVDAMSLIEKTPLSLVVKTPSDGCRTLVYALLAPGLPTGSYLSDCEITDVAPAAKDAASRRKLWEWTERWLEAKRTELQPPEPDVATDANAEPLPVTEGSDAQPSDVDTD